MLIVLAHMIKDYFCLQMSDFMEGNSSFKDFECFFKIFNVYLTVIAYKCGYILN